jgi:hypothetical protein
VPPKGTQSRLTTGEWTPEAIAAKREAKRAVRAAKAQVALAVADAEGATERCRAEEASRPPA